MRLDKLLYETGYGSKKQVRRLLLRKQVTVDHEIVLEEGRNVDPSLQEIHVLDRKIQYAPHVYYMLNKPAGVVSAVSDKEHQTVIDLIEKKDQREGLFPVGRLDRDTEGLLLITNNGKLGHRLLVPEKKVKKIYYAIVNEAVTEKDVLAFNQGIVFHGGSRCAPAALEILSCSDNRSEVLVEITEGKFHQVKKMFLSVGKKVTYLKRVTMGNLSLDTTINVGNYRPLNQEELRQMLHYFMD